MLNLSACTVVLVNSLENEPFDLMVISHTPIPLDIQKKVNVVLYDKKNEILTDWDMLNQPWFNPMNDRRIQSSFLSKKNTHLAIWRMMILGFSTAKNLGYNKLHHIEYDCEINDVTELIENSKILSEHDSVIYVENQPPIQSMMFGSFQSYNLNALPEKLLILDEEWIKQLIREASAKSPESMLQKILEESCNPFFKDRSDLETESTKFGLVDGQTGNNFIPWAVPFYDRLTHKVEFLVWNTKNENGVKHQIIINNERMVDVPFTEFNSWRIVYLDNLDSIESLLTLENNMVRDVISLKTQEEKEIFKNSSFRHKNGGEGDYG